MSVLIVAPFQKSAILVDAGIATNNSNNPLIYNYLRYNGVWKLAAVFLTHQHSDHINNLSFLKSRVKIKQIYQNINPKAVYNIEYFPPIVNYNYQLTPLSYSENNRSLVLAFKLFNHTFLVTGDIEAKVENLLIKNANLPKVTFLQVAHHGSLTSTTTPFLKMIDPKVAIISGKKTKKYQFPNDKIIKKLHDFKIKTYWTGKDKTIHIKIYQKFYIIKTSK